MIKGGPKIINDGLVLCLDAHDAKSYAGEPTTNLLGSNDNPLNGMSGVTFSKVETQTDGWIKYSMNGTFTGGGYPYICVIDSVSFTGGTAYTSRAMIKTNVESKFNYFGTTGINYVNQPKDAEGTSRSVVTEENGLNVYTVSREGFIYTSTTTQGGYLFTNPINNTTFSSSTDFVWIKNVQVEQKTYPTPWTYTSRSATNGWVDRTTNNNDGTLTNMVGTGVSHYRDGQVIMPVANSYLDFDGSDDRVNVAHSTQLNNAKTWEIWINMDSIPASNTFKSIFQKSANWNNNGGILLSMIYGNLRFSYGGYWGDLIIESLSNLSTNTWYQVVGTGEDTGSGILMKGYLNGVFKNSDTRTGAFIPTNTNTLFLGYGNGGYMDGKIGLVRVYNGILTAAEVLSNYNATKGRFS